VLKSLAIKPDYQLKAFGSHDTPWHERNTYGFIAGHVISHPRQPLSVCFTQLFRNNGGLYGINQNIATEEGERRVIDGDRLRREFEEALENYLEFYRRHPEFGDSVSVYLQLESIRGVFLKVRTPEGLQRIGPVIDPLLSDGAQNIPLDADVKSILRPLFVKLWDNAGVEYTD